MSFRRRLAELLVAVPVVFALMLAAPAAAVRAASFSPASLVSYTGGTQATDAYQPAISGDGADVVFVGIIQGVQGVWEKDLQTGALTLVAGTSSDAAIDAPDAGSPSVSANGEFVAFTSTADLTAADAGSSLDGGSDPDPDPTSGCANVWLRDMDIAAGQPGAYTLVSALNGLATGITYAGAGTSKCPGGGAASADRVAISADGNEVAFTVMGASDLTTAAASALTTPPDQVVVRYVAQQQTVLVSQTLASEQDGGTPAPVPGGAALTTNGEATTTATYLGGPAAVSLPISASTAAISADGSTVAWMGTNIPEQAPASSQDAGGATSFAEPLWRQIALGAGAPTRRVTGGDDPSAPGGAGPFDEFFANGDADSTDTGPEYGTMDAIEGFGAVDAVTPVLDADGQEVAFLANQPLEWQIPTGEAGYPVNGGGLPDAYLVNMAGGLTRDQALTQITEGAGDYDIAISPDGTKLAITTAATAFTLPSPALVTAPITSQTAGDAPQLYEVDLTAGTMSQVTYGYDGNPANGAVESPSFSSDGDTLAFASSATNLFYGAQNDGTNVFTVTEDTTPAVPGTVTITAAPASVTAITGPAWKLSVNAAATRRGTATVQVSVPGAGKLSAVATVLAPAGASRRTVAKASKQTAKAGVVALTLRPAKAYAARLDRRVGLYTSIKVSFTAKGHKTLTRTLQLTLHDRATAARKKKGKPKKKNKPKKKAKPTEHRAKQRKTGTRTRPEPGGKR